MASVDIALATISFKRKIAYKSTWIFSVLFGGWSLLAGLAVWSHLIGDGEMGGYDWQAMKAYLIIGFLTSTLAWAGSDWEMANRILDGLVAVDLTKPVDFQRARAGSTSAAWSPRSPRRSSARSRRPCCSGPPGRSRRSRRASRP
nr:hypothetical protein GCM10025732_47390 [Glycomyces mayteni]